MELAFHLVAIENHFVLRGDYLKGEIVNLVKRFAQGVFHFGRKFVNVDSRARDSLFLEVLLQNDKASFQSEEFRYGILRLYVLLRN